MDDKSLSTYAHNVKVVPKDGQVTLKGPVRSDEEKKSVEAKAVEVAGAGHVTNQISVAPEQPVEEVAIASSNHHIKGVTHMAGKNTAVFGIYSSVERAEHAVDALVLEHFSNDDVSVLMPDNQAVEGLRAREADQGAGRRRDGRRGRRDARRRAGSARRHRRPGHPWPRAVHCRRAHHGRTWRVSESAEPSAAWSARSSAWAFRNTRPSGTKVASRKAESSCRFTAIPPRTSRGRRRF